MRGFAGYQKTPTPWGWEYYPPPYRFASPYDGPGGVTPDYANARYMSMGSNALSRGMGCAGDCGCGCQKGIGQVDLSFLTNSVTVLGFTFPLWIGLAAGIGAIGLMSGLSDKRR